MPGKNVTIKQDAKSLDSARLVEANKRWNDFFGEHREEINAAVRAKRQVFEAWEAGVLTPEEYEVAKGLAYKEHKKIMDQMAEIRGYFVIPALAERQANAEKELHHSLASRMIDDQLEDSLSPGHEPIKGRIFTDGSHRGTRINETPEGFHSK